MTIDDIAKKYAETTDAICICGSKNYSEAVLILLYSAIDALSWLYSDQMDLDERNVGEDYRKWVSTFLLPNLEEYDCTATEIYLARCSILHTYSALAKNQKGNRMVAYAYGNKENIDRVNLKLPEIQIISGSKFVLLHIGDLVSGYIKGTSAFFKQIEGDKELFDKIIRKADNYYADTTDTINYLYAKESE